jgi:hypothetical protein
MVFPSGGSRSPIYTDPETGEQLDSISLERQTWLAAFLFANRSASDGRGRPSIAVDQNKIDYGYVRFGENR